MNEKNITEAQKTEQYLRLGQQYYDDVISGKKPWPETVIPEHFVSNPFYRALVFSKILHVGTQEQRERLAEIIRRVMGRIPLTERAELLRQWYVVTQHGDVQGVGLNITPWDAVKWAGIAAGIAIGGWAVSAAIKSGTIAAAAAKLAGGLAGATLATKVFAGIALLGVSEAFVAALKGETPEITKLYREARSVASGTAKGASEIATAAKVATVTTVRAIPLLLMGGAAIFLYNYSRR